jgi:hypothetical protein
LWVGLILLLTCGVLPFPVYRDILQHEYTLYREAWSLNQLKHPAGTNRIAFKKHVGLYLGNGNHCDYFVGELRRYTGRQAAIESFYSDKKVDNLNVNVAFVENGDFSDQLRRWSLPPGLNSLSYWLDPATVPLDHLYLVFIFDLDLDPGWDIRCM